MATATRIAQPAKVETVSERHVYREFRVITDNGSDISRTAQGPAIYGSVEKGRRVPQEDRIHLNLSLEEAHAIRDVMPHSSNSRANGIFRALAPALFPTVYETKDTSSPNAGTGPDKNATHATSGCGSSARYPSTTYKEPLAR